MAWARVTNAVYGLGPCSHWARKPSTTRSTLNGPSPLAVSATRRVSMGSCMVCMNKVALSVK